MVLDERPRLPAGASAGLAVGRMAWSVGSRCGDRPRRGSPQRWLVGDPIEGVRPCIRDHQAGCGHIPLRVGPTRVRVPSAYRHHRPDRSHRRAHDQRPREAREQAAARRSAGSPGVLAAVAIGSAGCASSTEAAAPSPGPGDCGGGRWVRVHASRPVGHGVWHWQDTGLVVHRREARRWADPRVGAFAVAAGADASRVDRQLDDLVRPSCRCAPTTPSLTPMPQCRRRATSAYR